MSNNNKVQEQFLQEFFAKIKGLSNHTNLKRIAIGVSGGSDSLALALMFGKWAEENACKIVVLTVDHALRNESKNEAEQVSKWLKKYGIEHKILTWTGDKPSSNIQSEARSARYDLMTDYCKSNKIDNLFIAHTKQDKAENFLIRALRGSGVYGLAAMAERSEYNGVSVVRPLLDNTREQLEEFLKQNNQEWISDPSNENDKYLRVKVRNFINSLDKPDEVMEHLNTSANNVARVKNFVEANVEKAEAEILKVFEAGYATINRQALLGLEDEIALRVLSNVILKINCNYYPARFENLINLHEQIKGNEFTGATLASVELFISKKKQHAGLIFVAKENAKIADNINLSEAAEHSVIWDDRFSCKLDNKIANDDTLFIGKLGSQGYKQILDENKNLAKSDLPKKILYTLPCLKTLEKVVCAPHINYCGDNKYKDLNKLVSIDFIKG